MFQDITTAMSYFYGPKVALSTRREMFFHSFVKKQEVPTLMINVVFHENKVFSGDFLAGRVVLDLTDSDAVIHEFTLEARGCGKTGWVNIHTDKIYETERDYLNTVISLAGSGSSVISPGRHQYPFQIPVPAECPTSYESQFGSIRYSLTVRVTTNSEATSATQTFPFYVFTKSFFDDFPISVLRPMETKDEVDFTVCALPFGTVSTRISVARIAYCLGETIEVHAFVSNRTRKALKHCALHLMLKTTYEAASRYEHVNEKKLQEQTIEQKELGKVKPRTDITFQNCVLKIPELAPPTRYSGSGEPCIIALSYVVRFTAVPGVETELPVIVTTHGSKEQPIHANGKANGLRNGVK
uniref:Arrestin_C domain-containing protein n=1 Tax=Steinernema glaseri TaxID=37863 RepID=A0A1I7YER7_9BILA